MPARWSSGLDGCRQVVQRPFSPEENEGKEGQIRTCGVQVNIRIGRNGVTSVESGTEAHRACFGGSGALTMDFLLYEWCL
jgi:hypothetical protein